MNLTNEQMMPQIELKIKQELSMLGREWQGVAGNSKEWQGPVKQ